MHKIFIKKAVLGPYPPLNIRLAPWPLNVLDLSRIYAAQQWFHLNTQHYCHPTM